LPEKKEKEAWEKKKKGMKIPRLVWRRGGRRKGKEKKTTTKGKKGEKGGEEGMP